MAYKLRKQYRYKGYDYSQEGFYFVTICVKNRAMFFGEVQGKYREKFIEEPFVQLSKIGEIAKNFWLEIPEHFSFVKLDEFIIMPDHIHGIVQIDKNAGTGQAGTGQAGTGQAGTGQCPVPTNTNTNDMGSKFGQVTSGSISTIVGSFKSIVKKVCNQNSLEFFAW